MNLPCRPMRRRHFRRRVGTQREARERTRPRRSGAHRVGASRYRDVVAAGCGVRSGVGSVHAATAGNPRTVLPPACEKRRARRKRSSSSHIIPQISRRRYAVRAAQTFSTAPATSRSCSSRRYGRSLRTMRVRATSSTVTDVPLRSTIVRHASGTGGFPAETRRDKTRAQRADRAAASRPGTARPPDTFSSVLRRDRGTLDVHHPPNAEAIGEHAELKRE